MFSIGETRAAFLAVIFVCAPGLADLASAAPPVSFDPTPANIDVAFRQALDEVGENEDLLDDWIDFFESIPTDGDPELRELVEDRLTELRALNVDYVRVCDSFGAGYYYIPGTDTCLRIGGRVRVSAPLDDPDLGTGQSVDLGPGWGGTISLGVPIPTNFDARFNVGFDLSRTQFDIQGLLNNVGPGVPADGALTAWAMLVALHMQHSLGNDWTVGLMAGFGPTHLALDLDAGAFGSLRGDDWTWSGRIGLEVERAIAKCATLALGAYLDRTGEVTISNLQFGPVTTLGLTAGLTYLLNPGNILCR